MKKSQQSKKKSSLSRNLFILSCIAIPIIQVLVFYVYANFSSIMMAFTNADGQWSLDNFVRFFNEFKLPSSSIRIALKNTMITFAILLVTFPFKVLVSFFIYKKVPFAAFYRIVFFLPSIVFSVAVAMVYTRMLDPNGFIANTIGRIMSLGYSPELLADSRFANYAIWAQMLWLGFPGDLIIWGGTFARIPVELLESARIDGVNWWGEFTKIVVPMVWPTVALKMVFLFCGIFGSSGSVFLLTEGNYGTETITSWMFKVLYQNSASRYSSNVYNYLSAVGLIITIIAVVISLTVRKFADKAFDEVEF